MARFYSAEMVCFYQCGSTSFTFPLQVFGVAALHGANILHRDLKLANMFIKADGHLCIGDFGLAISYEEVSEPVAEGQVAGTATHLAPETWVGKGYTTATDWWAVGVNIYHLLHGNVSSLPSLHFKLFSSIDAVGWSPRLRPRYRCGYMWTRSPLCQGFRPDRSRILRWRTTTITLNCVFLTLRVAAREGSQVSIWFHGSWRSLLLCLDVRLLLICPAVLRINSAWASVANGTLTRE